MLAHRCYVRGLENRCSRARRASSIADPDTIDFERAASTGDPIAMNTQTVLSDRALTANARAGGRNASGELVRRHSSLVFGMSLKMLRNREDAEENLQNAFCKAYGKIQQFEGNSQFSTCLLRIAINEALMTLRKRGAREVALCGDQDRAADDPRTKVELRDVHPDPERQYLVKELASKALDALLHPLKHTFILQKKKRAGRPGIARDSGHYPSKRKISHLSGARRDCANAF